MQTTRGTALTTDTSHTGSNSKGHAARYRLLWAAVAVPGLVLDQVTKHLAVTRLDPSDPVEVLGPLLRLQLVWNDGAAFSLGGGGQLTWLFTTFACIALVAVTLYAMFRVRHRGWAVILGLLGAGVSGNLTDRMFRPPSPGMGHVVDFLQLPYWPIFNIADICVSSAAVGIVWLAVIKNIGPDGSRPPAKGSDEDAAAPVDEPGNDGTPR